ncbi:alpha/beta hydrolase [Nocardia sp. NPDC051570]|uniref:preprotein translocase subunit SecA n=1 Tax=Nocardia sp. NPDC051570 TaxID=3364324 RepID=UPI00379F05BA
MTITMPPELQPVSYLAGSAWPEGDEDKMFDLAQVWRDAAAEVSGGSNDLVSQVKDIEAAIEKAYVSGPGRDSMLSTLETLTDASGDQSLQAVAKSMNDVADACDQVGCAIQSNKIQIYVGLLMLLWELYTSWTAGPAQPAVAAAEIAATRTALTIARTIAMEIIRAAAVGALTQAVIDAVIQLFQIATHHRKGFDWSEFGQSALAGGLGGALGAGAGKALGAGFSKMFGKSVQNQFGNRGAAIGRNMFEGIGGAVGGVVGGSLAAMPFNGGHFEWSTVGLLGGMAGVMSGGVRGYKAHPTGAGTGVHVPQIKPETVKPIEGGSSPLDRVPPKEPTVGSNGTGAKPEPLGSNGQAPIVDRGNNGTGNSGTGDHSGTGDTGANRANSVGSHSDTGNGQRPAQAGNNTEASPRAGGSGNDHTTVNDTGPQRQSPQTDNSTPVSSRPPATDIAPKPVTQTPGARDSVPANSSSSRPGGVDRGDGSTPARQSATAGSDRAGSANSTDKSIAVDARRGDRTASTGRQQGAADTRQQGEPVPPPRPESGARSPGDHQPLLSEYRRDGDDAGIAWTDPLLSDIGRGRPLVDRTVPEFLDGLTKFSGTALLGDAKNMRLTAHIDGDRIRVFDHDNRFVRSLDKFGGSGPLAKLLDDHGITHVKTIADENRRTAPPHSDRPVRQPDRASGAKTDPAGGTSGKSEHGGSGPGKHTPGESGRRAGASDGRHTPDRAAAHHDFDSDDIRRGQGSVTKELLLRLPVVGHLFRLIARLLAGDPADHKVHFAGTEDLVPPPHDITVHHEDPLPLRPRADGKPGTGLPEPWHLTKEVADQFRVVAHEGKLYNARTGKLVHTPDAPVTKWSSRPRQHLFVADRSGNLYIAPDLGWVRTHQSFDKLGVHAAGTIEVHNGVLRTLTDHSGPYLPNRSRLTDLLENQLRDVETHDRFRHLDYDGKPFTAEHGPTETSHEPRDFEAEAHSVLHDHAEGDWADRSSEQLTHAMKHGTEHEAMAAAIEVIRRGEGKTLYWTQVMAVLAMQHGPINMDAGEGKSLVFLTDAMLKSSREQVVQVYTTRDTLAKAAFDQYRKTLEPYGFDIVRMNPDHEYTPPVEGRSTIYIGTQNDAGFGRLRDHAVPGRRAAIDEIDEALVHADTTFILSDGPADPAGPEVKAQVEQAHTFLDEHLRKGDLTEADFGRAKDQLGGRAELTSSGRAKLEGLWDGELTESDERRIAMAASARWEFIENDHYIVHDGRVLIIDQTTHKVMFDPETSTESRWNGGLAQAVEAKHGLMIRSDSDSSKSLSAQQLFSKEHYDSLTGASGTAEGVSHELQEQYKMQAVVKIPRFKDSNLKVDQDGVAEDLAGKHRMIAEDVAAKQKTGQPQLVIANRNSEVSQLSKLLRAMGIEHEYVDAAWFAEQGPHAEQRLQEIFDRAGREGKVLIINRQGGRGVDIAVSDEVSAKHGGLHVVVTSRSAESRDIDIQAENRAARNGQNGSVRYYVAADDALYAQSNHRDVSTAIIRYTNAAKAHQAEHTTTTENELHKSEGALRELVPRLQHSGVARPSVKDAVVQDDSRAQVDLESASDKPVVPADTPPSRPPARPPAGKRVTFDETPRVHEFDSELPVRELAHSQSNSSPTPATWQPVHSATDPLFGALAVAFNISDADSLRTALADHLAQNFDRYRQQFIPEQLKSSWDEERARRDSYDAMVSNDPEAAQSHEVTEQNRRWNYDSSFWQQVAARLNQAHGDFGRPADSGYALTHHELLTLAGDRFGANLVLEHPVGSPTLTAGDPRFPTLHLRHSDSGDYDVGLNADGSLFASVRPIEPTVPPVAGAIPRKDIPQPLARVLASPHIPLLDGAVLGKHYTGETRPVRVLTTIDLTGSDVVDRTKFEFAPHKLNTPTHYMTPAEREQHRIFVGHDGRLYQARDGAPFDTTGAKFVMDEFGNLYSGNTTVVTFHSSFLAGKTVTAAGYLVVRDGQLMVMTDHSGHYQPRPEINDYALDLLRRQGLVLDPGFQRRALDPGDRTGFNGPVRERVGEMERQSAEVERRRRLLHAQDTVLARRERRANAAEIGHQLGAERQQLAAQAHDLDQWSRVLAAGYVRPSLTVDLWAHPIPVSATDRIVPPEFPAGLAGTDMTLPVLDRTRRLANWWDRYGRQWWEDLRFSDLSAEYQHRLVTDFPVLRNSGGIPAAVRDTLNRSYADTESRLLAGKPVLSRLEAQRRRDLDDTLVSLCDAELEARLIAGRSGIDVPPVHLLRVDPATSGRPGAAMMSFGDIDTTGSVSWHVPGDRTASASMSGDPTAAMMRYVAEKRRNPSPAVATVTWVDRARRLPDARSGFDGGNPYAIDDTAVLRPMPRIGMTPPARSLGESVDSDGSRQFTAETEVPRVGVASVLRTRTEAELVEKMSRPMDVPDEVGGYGSRAGDHFMSEVNNADAHGMKGLADALVREFPPGEFRYVGVGASAELVSEFLHQVHDVDTAHVAISAMETLGRVDRLSADDFAKVKGYLRASLGDLADSDAPLVLLDATNTGASLLKMKQLIARMDESEGRPPRRVDLVSLTHAAGVTYPSERAPKFGTEEPIHRLSIPLSDRPTSYALERIFWQLYKYEVPRAYPKVSAADIVSGKHVAPPARDEAAHGVVSRVVAAMVRVADGSFTELKDLSPEQQQDLRYQAYKDSNSNPVSRKEWEVMDDAAQRSGDEEEYNSDDFYDSDEEVRLGATAIEARRHANDCGPRALRQLIDLTGSAKVRMPEHPVGVTGMSQRDLEDAAGASLRPVADHGEIAARLLGIGEGATALVLDTYHGPTDAYGVGAHAYLLRMENGAVVVIDPGAGLRHGFPPVVPKELGSTRAIVYSAHGEPVDAPVLGQDGPEDGVPRAGAIISVSTQSMADLVTQLRRPVDVPDKIGDYDLLSGGDHFTGHVDNADAHGVKGLADAIVREFPPGEHRFVGLGASAEVVSEFLRQGHGLDVGHVAISDMQKLGKIDGLSDVEFAHLKAYVRAGLGDLADSGDHLVLLDATDTGASLVKMKQLIQRLDESEGRPPREVTLVSLTHSASVDYPGQRAPHFATEQIVRLSIPLSDRATSYALERIFWQLYKHELPRAYPKMPAAEIVSGRHVEPPVRDEAAHGVVSRVVAAMVQVADGSFTEFKDLSPEEQQRHRYDAYKRSNSAPVRWDEWKEMDDAAQRSGDEEEYDSDDFLSDDDAPRIGALPQTEPAHWEPVPAASDHLFEALARVTNAADSGVVSSQVADYLYQNFEYYRPLITTAELQHAWTQESNYRHSFDISMAALPVESAGIFHASERDRRANFDHWFRTRQMDILGSEIHALRGYAVPAGGAQIFVGGQRADLPLLAAINRFQMNLVMEHQGGTRQRFEYYTGQPVLYLRHAEDGHYDIGLNADGTMFSTPGATPLPPARPLGPGDVLEVPPRRTRMLASAQIPLLDGAVFQKHYTGETRPIRIATELDLSGEQTIDRDTLAQHPLRYFTPVHYMNDAERESHRLFVGSDGRLHRASDGTPFHSPAAIFVMDEFGNLYSGEKQVGYIHHSSFLGGRTATAAGFLDVRDGWLVSMSDSSGHYSPRPKINDFALDLLRRQGLLLGDHFQKLDNHFQPRHRVDEVARQTVEVERRQQLLDAAARALTRLETEPDHPQQVSALQAERRMLRDEQENLERWREELRRNEPRPYLRQDTRAHPEPTSDTDRIVPPRLPAGLDRANSTLPSRARIRELADWWQAYGESWWAELHFADLSPEYQYRLVTDFPGLRNSEGIPAETRDALNRTYLDTALRKAREANPQDPRRVASLEDMQATLYTAVLQAEIVARQRGIDEPPVHLLKFDPGAFEGRGAAIIGFGDVDNANAVSWHVPGGGISLASMVRDLHAAMDRYATRQLAAPDRSVASVVWSDYKLPAESGGFSDRLLSKLPPVRAAGRLRSALHAFGEARRLSGDTPDEIRVTGDGFGSKLADRVARNMPTDPHEIDGSRPHRAQIGAATAESTAEPIRRANDCGPLALAELITLTGSTYARMPDHPVGLAGMSYAELGTAAGGRLERFADHQAIADRLLDIGAGATALVVDRYRGLADAHGIGAHAYLLRAEDGAIVVHDPGAGRRHGFPPRVAKDLESTRAILYSAHGVPVHESVSDAGGGELGWPRIGAVLPDANYGAATAVTEDVLSLMLPGAGEHDVRVTSFDVTSLTGYHAVDPGVVDAVVRKVGRPAGRAGNDDPNWRAWYLAHDADHTWGEKIGVDMPTRDTRIDVVEYRLPANVRVHQLPYHVGPEGPTIVYNSPEVVRALKEHFGIKPETPLMDGLGDQNIVLRVQTDIGSDERFEIIVPWKLAEDGRAEHYGWYSFERYAKENAPTFHAAPVPGDEPPLAGGAGDSVLGREHAEELEGVVAPEGCWWESQPGQGNCLWEALGRALGVDPHDREAHEDFRVNVVAHMLDNPERYLGEFEAHRPHGERETEFEKQLRALLGTGQWNSAAAERLLPAAAKALEMNLEVVHPGGGVHRLHFGPPDQPVNVLFRSPSGGGHYWVAVHPEGRVVFDGHVADHVPGESFVRAGYARGEYSLVGGVEEAFPIPDHAHLFPDRQLREDASIALAGASPEALERVRDILATHGRDAADLLTQYGIKKRKKDVEVGDVVARLEESLHNLDEVRRRGYPYLLKSRRDFELLAANVLRVAGMRGIDRGDVTLRVQGSSVHKPTAGDIDIALIVNSRAFERYGRAFSDFSSKDNVRNQIEQEVRHGKLSQNRWGPRDKREWFAKEAKKVEISLADKRARTEADKAAKFADQVAETAGQLREIAERAAEDARKAEADGQGEDVAKAKMAATVARNKADRAEDRAVAARKAAATAAAKAAKAVVPPPSREHETLEATLGYLLYDVLPEPQHVQVSLIEEGGQFDIGPYLSPDDMAAVAIPRANAAQRQHLTEHGLVEVEMPATGYCLYLATLATVDHLPEGLNTVAGLVNAVIGRLANPDTRTAYSNWIEGGADALTPEAVERLRRPEGWAADLGDVVPHVLADVLGEHGIELRVVTETLDTHTLNTEPVGAADHRVATVLRVGSAHYNGTARAAGSEISDSQDRIPSLRGGAVDADSPNVLPGNNFDGAEAVTDGVGPLMLPGSDGRMLGVRVRAVDVSSITGYHAVGEGVLDKVVAEVKRPAGRGGNDDANWQAWYLAHEADHTWGEKIGNEIPSTVEVVEYHLPVGARVYELPYHFDSEESTIVYNDSRVVGQLKEYFGIDPDTSLMDGLGAQGIVLRIQTDIGYDERFEIIVPWSMATRGSAVHFGTYDFRRYWKDGGPTFSAAAPEEVPAEEHSADPDFFDPSSLDSLGGPV